MYLRGSKRQERVREDGTIWYFDNCELSQEDLIRTLWKFNELDYFKYDLNNNFSQNINPDFNSQTNLNIQSNSIDFNTENYQNPTRAIFIFNKIKTTKNIYPRKAGIPAKTPL